MNANRAKGDAMVLKAWQQLTQKTLRPAVAKAAFASIRYTTYTTRADAEALQKFTDLNYKLGILRDKPDLSGFIWKAK